MSTIYYKGKTFVIDNKGFLVNYLDYCEEWKEYSSQASNIFELSFLQNRIIKIIREYYIERGSVPAVRYISKILNLMPSDIYKEFSGGLYTAVKISGLPAPKMCS